jgi:DNA-binding phage protein
MEKIIGVAAVTKTKTKLWDASAHLETEADVVAYLEAALEQDDPRLISAALDDISHARKSKNQNAADRSR